MVFSLFIPMDGGEAYVRYAKRPSMVAAFYLPALTT